MADSNDVEQWKRDLIAAGWAAESATAWRAPDGSLWRGPYGAWKELQRRQILRAEACSYFAPLGRYYRIKGDY